MGLPSLREVIKDNCYLYLKLENDRVRPESTVDPLIGLNTVTGILNNVLKFNTGLHTHTRTHAYLYSVQGPKL